MKRIIFVIALFFILVHPCVGQTVLFQARIDELYSSAKTYKFPLTNPPTLATTNHTWKFQTKLNECNFLLPHSTMNECWGIDSPETDTWFSSGLRNYTADVNCGDKNLSCRLIRNQNVSLGSTFYFRFQGYDHDEYGRCSEADDQICGWTAWCDNSFVISYDNFAKNNENTKAAPGGWLQVPFSFCNNGFYRARISFYIEPPKVNIGTVVMSKNGVSAEANYCQGETIFLKVNDTSPGVIEHNDIEYVWQYNLNDETTIIDSYCTQWEWSNDPNCQTPQFQLSAQQAAPVEGDCQYCVQWQYVYGTYWRSATVSNSKTAQFVLPYTGKYRFRVAIRNKTTGRMGKYSDATPQIFTYDRPPVLNDVPADGDLVLDNTSELNYISNSLDIQHVACKAASTGKIKIKKLVGNGSYYYTLKNNDGKFTININGNSVGAPSTANPVIFPDYAFNKGDLAGLPAGSYTLIIENFDDPGFGTQQRLCSNQYTIYVKEPATSVSTSFEPIAKGNGNPYPISCYGMSDGAITATGGGGIGPYNFSLTSFTSQPGSSSVTFSGLSTSGSYNLIVNDALNCPSPTVVVNNLQQPAPLSLTDPQLEYYDNAGLYNITCNGGTGPLTFFTKGDAALTRKVQVVNGPSDNDVANDADPVIFSLAKGTYTVKVSYPFGCEVEAVNYVTLAEPPPIDVTTVSVQHPSCVTGKGTNDNDGYITLQASGGITKANSPYKLYLTTSPSAILEGSPVTFNNLSALTYTVVAQDAYCSKPFQVTVPANPKPVSFAGLATIVEPTCNEYDDGKITVAGKNGYPFNSQFYEFSINTVKKSGQFASTTFDMGITKGSYTLRINDSKGCWSDTTVTVSQPLALSRIFSVTPNVCRHETNAELSASLSGGTGPYDIQWWKAPDTEGEPDVFIKSENVASLTKITGLAAGNYLLKMKDSRGCTNKEPDWYTSSREVIDPDTLKLSVFSVEHISCYEANDGYISLAASGGWSSYRYSDDNITFTVSSEFTDRKPGIQEFFVKDAKGCVRSTTQVINEPAILEASPDKVVDAQCFDFANGSVQLQIAGGTQPYYVARATGQPWIEGNIVNGLKAGAYTIQVKDDNGCPQSVEAIVKEPELLVLDLVETISSTCSEANGQGSVIASGGIIPYAYRWYSSANQVVAHEAKGINLYADVYTVEVVDNNQCITPLEVTISDIGGAKVDQWKITDAICSYSSDGAIDITITEGTQPYQISWTNGAQSEDIEGVLKGDYRVQIIDAKNCKLFKTFTVGAPPPLGIDIVDSQPPTCFEYDDAFIEVAFTGGNGGYTYQWQNGAEGTRLEKLTAGKYSIVLFDNKGCKHEQTITIDDPPKLTLGMEDRTICVGQIFTVALPVENGTYKWTSPNGFESYTRTVSLTEPGRYFVNVTDEKGCKAEENFQLNTSTDLLKAELLVAREAFAGDTVVVIDISWPLPDRIVWKFDQSHAKVIYEDQNFAEVIFDKSGVYTVGIDAFLGKCHDNNSQLITILGEKEDDSGGRVADRSMIAYFELHPNPNDGHFTVSVVLAEPVPARLRMLNLTGNINLIDYRVTNTLEFEYQANLHSISSGIYFLVIEAGRETRMKRVVIK